MVKRNLKNIKSIISFISIFLFNFSCFLSKISLLFLNSKKQPCIRNNDKILAKLLTLWQYSFHLNINKSQPHGERKKRKVLHAHTNIKIKCSLVYS